MSAQSLTLALEIINSEAFKAFLKWVLKTLSNRFYYFCKICGKNATSYCKNVNCSNQKLFSRQKICKNCCPCNKHHSSNLKFRVKTKSLKDKPSCSNPSCPSCSKHEETETTDEEDGED